MTYCDTLAKPLMDKVELEKKTLDQIAKELCGNTVKRPRQKAKQPNNLDMVIESINPIIRGWRNYFKGGTVKKSFEELDEYIRGRLRSFQAKRRHRIICKINAINFYS